MPLTQPTFSSRIRALVDCDWFFAWCEIARNPSLIWKPVCVCREKDIVVACSYEAKKYGIKTWTASWDSRRILWDKGVFIAPDMAYYIKTSQKVMALLAEEANSIEVFSVDEAFIDITQFGEESVEFYQLFAKRIVDRVWNELRISVSIWVAPTKLLAKMFSSLRKPKGVFVCLDRLEIPQIIGDRDLQKIPFIWYKTANRFDKRIQKIRDFLSLSEEYIQHAMSVVGVRLYRELQCINALSFQKPDKPKSIWRSRSFHPDFTSNIHIVRWHLVQNFEFAFKELIDTGGRTCMMTLSCRLKDFRSYALTYKFSEPTNNKKILVQAMKDLFIRLFNKHNAYRSTWITFHSIDYAIQKYGLFDAPKENDEKLAKTVNHLNQKFGKQIITSANNIQQLRNSSKEHNGFTLWEVEV